MSRPYLDRTSEFRSAVESAAFRAASSSSSASAPLLNNNNNNHAGGRAAQRSEFARMAAKIGKDIQGTTGKLEKLAQRTLSFRPLFLSREEELAARSQRTVVGDTLILSNSY